MSIWTPLTAEFPAYFQVIFHTLSKVKKLHWSQAKLDHGGNDYGIVMLIFTMLELSA
jgi:hypothetical protein